MDDPDDFDWDTHLDKSEEVKSFERKLRILLPLAQTCKVCCMCDLGFRKAEKNGDSRDPHVFSNLNPQRFMIVGQNPGWTELLKDEPFVGSAGLEFDVAIQKHGLNRSDFYICNAVRCYTNGNMRPIAVHLEKCEPYLRMEINIIKPKLIIALGAVAFEQLCPDENFTQSLRKIVKSKKYDNYPVFTIYHPSPLNLEDEGRRKSFESQIELMCRLIKSIKSSDKI